MNNSAPKKKSQNKTKAPHPPISLQPTYSFLICRWNGRGGEHCPSLIDPSGNPIGPQKLIICPHELIMAPQN